MPRLLPRFAVADHEIRAGDYVNFRATAHSIARMFLTNHFDCLRLPYASWEECGRALTPFQPEDDNIILGAQ